MPRTNDVLKKIILNQQVKFELHYGTVVESDTEITGSGHEAVGVWIRQENGDEYRLQKIPGAVPAREGHRFGWLDIDTPTHRYEDAIRYNITTGSVRSNVSYDEMANNIASESLNWSWLLIAPFGALAAWQVLGFSLMPSLLLMMVLALAVLVFNHFAESVRKKRALKKIHEELRLVGELVGKRKREEPPVVSEPA